MVVTDHFSIKQINNWRHLDNAVVENFLGLLKTELFYLEEIDSVDQLEKLLLSISTITTTAESE